MQPKGTSNCGHRHRPPHPQRGTGALFPDAQHAGETCSGCRCAPRYTRYNSITAATGTCRWLGATCAFACFKDEQGSLHAHMKCPKGMVWDCAAGGKGEGCASAADEFRIRCSQTYGRARMELDQETACTPGQVTLSPHKLQLGASCQTGFKHLYHWCLENSLQHRRSKARLPQAQQVGGQQQGMMGSRSFRRGNPLSSRGLLLGRA